MNFKHVSIVLFVLISAHAFADISLKAGEWETESVMQIDGVKPFTPNDIEQKMLAKATPEQRAAYEKFKANDPELSKSSNQNSRKSYLCNEKPSPSLKPREYAEKALKNGTSDVWKCSLEAGSAIHFDNSFHFSCITSLGAKSDGDINFSFLEKSYTTEIISKSHAVDETGKPLSSQQASSHLIMKGRWLSEQCKHSSVNKSVDER